MHPPGVLASLMMLEATGSVTAVNNTGIVPNVACPNETDRFSVNSSVAHLKYPVGLLTADEIILAGANDKSNTSNNNYYLYTGDFYWTMSPKYIYYLGNYVFRVIKTVL